MEDDVSEDEVREASLRTDVGELRLVLRVHLEQQLYNRVCAHKNNLYRNLDFS